MAKQDQIDGYAATIFEFAKAEGQLETIGDELFQIARTFESSSELRDSLSDPRLPVEIKQSIISDLLDTRASVLTVNLINFPPEMQVERTSRRSGEIGDDDLRVSLEAAIQGFVEAESQVCGDAVELQRGKR